ncbi:MAG: (2Fe-2S)-binding protein [Candidatus Eisenbacteria sp.]|nr:(2Fe-2S)-binding protein [Candidatus Eisenbacteria bacterium]
MTIKLKIDKQDIEVPEGTTILEAARMLGIRIPTLCHHEALKPYGACRICLVEVRAGTARASTLVASCVFPVRQGLEVTTDSDEIREVRAGLLELLLARCPGSRQIRELAGEFGVHETPYTPRDHLCILCGLCVRVCDEIVGARAIDFSFRGQALDVKPPLLTPAGTCIACGTCTTVCPTEAVKLEEIARVPYGHAVSETHPGERCRVCGTHPTKPEFPANYDDWFPK